jgi:hypothetical protein
MERYRRDRRYIRIIRVRGTSGDKIAKEVQSAENWISSALNDHEGRNAYIAVRQRRYGSAVESR